MDPMLGMIYLVPFKWAPQDYFICQGQLVKTVQYQALYSLIGTMYGGDQVNFGLPNLQGRIPLGFGTTSGTTTDYPITQASGSSQTTLTIANLPAHTHASTFAPTKAPQSVTIPAATGNLQVGVTVNATTSVGTNPGPSGTTNMLSNTNSGTAKVYGPTVTTGLVPLGGTSATVTGTAPTAAANVDVNTVTGGTVTIGVAGLGQPATTLPPVLALNFIIAMSGIYPSRPN